MDWTGQKYLDQFVDEGLEVDPQWSPDAERQRQITRLAPEVLLMRAVRDHPGRLPESAGREARKGDKLNAKRAENRLFTAFRQWLGVDHASAEGWLESWRDDAKNIETLAALRIQAAQIKWGNWWAKHQVELNACLRHIATNAKGTGAIREGNRMVNRIANEYQTLDEAFGNLPTEPND